MISVPMKRLAEATKQRSKATAGVSFSDVKTTDCRELIFLTRSTLNVGNHLGNLTARQPDAKNELEEGPWMRTPSQLN
jgi:hypothetical protein